ncbi:MAG: PhnD/SsuA/transferrin family substrate-binding protein [Helicobacteraceae bacterium]|nr:PhnD/SsuA/transferrin family substrate-binding protein [Helicobacteraceae bacterium]
MIQRLFTLLFFVSVSLMATETVKIGVLAKRSPAITMAKWSATAAYLNSTVEGYEFVIVPLDFDELSASVANAKIDFVLTNTMLYVELEHNYGISRIATLKNISSKGDVLTRFGGVIVTKKRSGIESLEALKGKRFGAVDSDSFGGWVMAQKELYDHGITREDFSDFIFFGTHDGVVSGLDSGEIDAGTVRTDTLEQMAKEGSVDLNTYRILAQKQYEGFPFKVSTALYPEWPFSKLLSTSDTLAAKVLSALLQISPEFEAARASQTAGWTIPQDYTSVHTVLNELYLFHHIEPKYLTFSDFYEKYKSWFLGLISGLLAVFAVLLYIFRLNSRLRDGKVQIEALNADLEEKVEERTWELAKLYSREKYLKDNLNTISEVNELLITSFTREDVVTNSLLTLVKHVPYQFVLIGLTEENRLETVNCSGTDNGTIKQCQFNLDALESSVLSGSVKNALEGNRPVIEQFPQGYRCDIGTTRCSCSGCRIITLPLKNNEQEAPIGHLTILSDREEGFEPEEIKRLEKLAIDISMTLHSVRQRGALEALEREKISNYEETILAFVNIIEQRDSYTAGHTIRVAKYCRLIAEAMHLPKEQIVTLEKAAILHDIGKVVTPDAILLKPGKLTELEYELIKQHSDAGFRMLSEIDMYKDLADIIYFHHVHYDGKGYPALPDYNRESVHLLSYIMAAADAFDAMTTNRIYKSSKSREDAIEEIMRCSGTQFHPDVSLAAFEALTNVSIVETTQLPDNTLEHHRFSYFFLDALTDLYNENYLKTVLGTKERKQGYLTLVQLKRFADYNQKMGWNGGNRFLKDFGAMLKELYPQAMVFRYHGDGFVLLFDHVVDVSEEQLAALPLLRENNMEVHLRHYNLKEGIPEL